MRSAGLSPPRVNLLVSLKESTRGFYVDELLGAGGLRGGGFFSSDLPFQSRTLGKDGAEGLLGSRRGERKSKAVIAASQEALVERARELA